MRSIQVAERRALLTRRHHLAGDATSPEQIARSLIALHATDPASVVVSTLVRGAGLGIDELLAAMYERRSLVRWMAMRRTLFVFPVETVPIVQAAVSLPLAATLRGRLLRQLERNGTVPPIEGDLGAWLAAVEAGVHDALLARGTATGLQLSAAEPRARTTITPRAPSERPQNVTSQLLTIMSTEARIVRGSPTGAWTTRQHRWEPVERWWPEGMPAVPVQDARAALVRTWLERFGPARVEDVEWWTGWGKGVVRTALSALPVEEVDLHGEPGVTLAGSPGEASAPGAAAPVLTLLPALDPTPMGWGRREWFTGIDPGPLYDRYGNIGPTIWWDGEIVGGWAVADSGEVRTAVVADRGAEVVAAAERAAASLRERIGGVRITPVMRTPLERSLVS